jgi:ribose/xylose/arabinose/galactoside ABC-type transport system permease subunit
MSKYGIYFALLGLFLIMAFATPSFLKPANLFNVVRQSATIGIVAVGMTFVIITGGIDLSVGSIVAAASVVATSYATNNNISFPLWVAILLGILVGAAFGAFNGFFVAKMKVAPFIVTLATLTIARGFALIYTSGSAVFNLTSEFNEIGKNATPIIIFVCVILVGVFLLNFTKFGRHIFAVGGNEQTAIVSGVNVIWTKFSAYIIAGVCAAIAAIVLSARTETGQPASADGYELDAIAAVVIGGSSLSGGVGSVIGTVVGMLIIGIVTNGLELMNVSSYMQKIVKGAIILVAVLVDRKRAA